LIYNEKYGEEWMELKNKIFVIMPFTGRAPHSKKYWTDHFEKILKPCVHMQDFPIERSSPLRKDIVKEIISNLILSKIVLADISGKNSNVMWELGVRQSFRNGTIVIAEDGTKPPFNITTKSIIFYPKLLNPDYDTELDNFKEQLKKAVDDCKNYPDDIDSHIFEVISGRGTVYEIISREESIRKLDSLIEEFEFNCRLLQDMDNLIDENREFLKSSMGDGVDLTLHFRTQSIDLLLTTRYLIQDVKFYATLQRYRNDLVRLNSTIESLPRDRRSTVGWYAMFRPQFEYFKTVLTKIIEIQQDIKDRRYL
jgi:hypothetical protein